MLELTRYRTRTVHRKAREAPLHLVQPPQVHAIQVLHGHLRLLLLPELRLVL
jgi:hypothetical protein